MATSDTLINTLFDGRYRIVRRLGAGGMANVYLAEDEQLGRRVAIKVLNDRYAQDEAFVERFRREAKSAAALSHPNIVSIYDRGAADGHPYIAMEVIEGRSLKELIVSRGPLPVAKAVDYAQQILAALRFAHRNGIIHRDIKPHNILIGAEERLKVTDFGIARAGASQMTETGSIMGTAQYLSPEQARGSAVHAPSDLYSVGIVLYEMLTGQVPYTGDSAIEVAMKHVNERPIPPSAVAPGIPHALDEVVLRALAKQPADRYHNADEFSDDLRRVAAGLPPAPETSEAATAVLSAPSGGSTEVLPRDRQRRAGRTPPRRPPDYPPGGYPPPAKRRRRSVFPWLLVIGLLIAAAAAGWYVYNRIQDQLEQSEPAAVPYVVGLDESNAKGKIVDAQLQPVVDHAPSKSALEGKVFRQDPQAGKRLAKDETVRIIVSTGKPQVDVPTLVGQTYDSAASNLDDRDLVAQRTDVYSSESPGIVVSQDPKPGVRVETGTTVAVHVSKGEQTFTIPDVRGQWQTPAIRLLQSYGFNPVTAEASSEEPVGRVIDESPAGGTAAPHGTTVTLTVSKGPETKNVPNVVSLDRESAIASLKSAGFEVDVQEEPTLDPNKDNTVSSQAPDANSSAPVGSTVTIVVGVYVPSVDGGATTQ
jgi:serine/threonine-protein kinase